MVPPASMVSFSHSLLKYEVISVKNDRKMVVNKSTTSLIRHIQKNISLMMINDIILMLMHSYNTAIFSFSVHVIWEVFLLFALERHEGAAMCFPL